MKESEPEIGRRNATVCDGGFGPAACEGRNSGISSSDDVGVSGLKMIGGGGAGGGASVAMRGELDAGTFGGPEHADANAKAKKAEATVISRMEVSFVSAETSGEPRTALSGALLGVSEPQRCVSRWCVNWLVAEGAVAL